MRRLSDGTPVLAKPKMIDTLETVLEEAYDADEQEVSLSYVWTDEDGLELGSGDSLSAADLERGSEVTCTVTPNDGSETVTVPGSTVARASRASCGPHLTLGHGAAER